MDFTTLMNIVRVIYSLDVARLPRFYAENIASFEKLSNFKGYLKCRNDETTHP